MRTGCDGFASVLLALHCGVKAFKLPEGTVDDADKLSRESVVFYLTPAALFYLRLTFAWGKACYDSGNNIGP